MNLRKKESISNTYNIIPKKSTYFSERIDLFIIIIVVILILTPVIFSLFSKSSSKTRLIDLYISAYFEDYFGNEITETLIREFEEQNPDVRIRLAYYIDEKGAPVTNESDILIFDKGDFSGLAARGALAPFKPFIVKDEADESAESEETEAEELFAIPLVSFMDLLFYNIELLKAAGYDRPPKTRDEFLAYARTVSSGNNAALEGAAGTAVGLSPQDRQALSRDIFSWIWAGPNDFWQDSQSLAAAQDGLRDVPLINTRTIARGDIVFFGTLYREGILGPDSFEKTGEQRLEEFAEGKIAMIVASTRAIASLREKMGDEVFGITTIPGSGMAGKYNIALSGIYAGINSDCENMQTALAFLEYLAKYIPVLCAHLKAVPGDTTDLFSSDYKNYMKDDAFYSKAWEIFESSRVVQGFFGNAFGEEYESIFREEFQKFFEDTQTSITRAADAAVRAIQQRWDEVGLEEMEEEEPDDAEKDSGE
jgi:multiple sugar transport system substrate-binding protein